MGNVEEKAEVKLVDIKERQGSLQTELNFHKVNADTVDLDLGIKKFRKKLLPEGKDVFKKDHQPSQGQDS